MRTLYVFLVLVFAACYSPTFTHCPDVDCPTGRVCDGQGGCALQGQVDACTGVSSGDPCSYRDPTGKDVSGECTMQGVCLPLGCGNGVVTPDEVCDDGNNVSGDGCSADCQSNETCGNGTVDSAAGEQCDDGNTQDGDGCQHDCKQARCGDGVTDTIIGEECDSGAANSSAPDAPCRTNCQLPRCGDNVVDPAHGEVCDDGNNQSADGCSGDCKSNESCGNGVIDALAGEVCDDGNTSSGDGCSGDCKSLEICGNGVVDAVRGEVCDDGNTVSGDGCSSDCKSKEVCGNAIVDVAELCDLGSGNSNVPDSQCRTNCKLPVCGDAITDPLHGEACDNGVNNSDTKDKCRTNCQLPRCGDLIVDTGEACDDGNTTSGDGCSADCKSKETCGNAIVDVAKGEQCDNGSGAGGNSSAPNALCRTDCTRRQCGDAIVDNLFGELCDQGVNNSDLPNQACRTNCLPARCGDHIVDLMNGEVCDDGNTTSGDGCSSTCNSTEFCGNGVVDVVKGEQCDVLGGDLDTPNALCRSTCVLPKCGDGIIDNLRLGEACDDGVNNADAKDKCRTNCQLPRCGDHIVDTGEVCDDGNTVSGDGCSADCKSTENCGNAIVDVAKGEQCDLGTGSNSDLPNMTCRTNCKLQRCGDSIIDDQHGEVCDQGAANSNAKDAACRTNCLPKRCGDFVVDTGEACDDGNLVSGDGCSADCQSTENCGNGIVDVAKGEQCDLGSALNSNLPNKTCRTNCQRQQCGDSIVDPAFGEACDAGSANSNLPNQTCRANCQPQRCGDGILDDQLGEVCDDGNNTSGDGCSADCKSKEKCGNAIVDVAAGEQCDLGSANNLDTPNAGCRSNCKLPTCGDGIVDTSRGEQCDAGSSNSNLPNAPCRLTCFLPKCGDGVIDTLAGEICDDSNNNSGDGCASDCKSNETCGNGVVDFVKGELCDDGNTRAFDGCSACQPETDILLTPNSTPPARSGAAIAYDGARQRVVMFGGKGASVSFADTWEWDGVSWTRIPTAHTPAARYAAAMAYDAKRHRIVLFGGTTTNPAGTDTWEYDGTDWTQKLPATQPSGRSDAAMAFDAVGGRIVLFGGTGDGSTGSSETWGYDGTNWSSITSGSPAARFGAKMTFDSAHGYVVMFGGNTGDTHTYTFTGSTWSDKGSTGGPATGSDVTAMAYDANIGKAVISDSSASTYEWSGAVWTTVAGAPTTTRTVQAMTYDAIRKQLVLFGGLNAGSPLADTWLRSTQTWSQPAAFTLPPARMRSESAFDPIRKRVVLFGGQSAPQRRYGCTNASCMSQDTWEWDGRKWTQANPTTPPPVRAGAWLDYDPVGRVIRMYGGDSSNGGTGGNAWTTYNDVYTYNGASWSQVGTAGTRTVARTAAAAWDWSAGRFVTFGGNTGETAGANGSTGSTIGQTWYWDGSWHQNTSTPQPGPRDNSAMAYDPVRNRTVIFSGNPRDGTTADDTWEWNNSTWTLLANNAGPPTRDNHRMFFNPDTSHVTLFGSSGMTAGEDVWEWNGTAWNQRPLVGTYPYRYAPAAAYDAVNHEIVAFSGRNNDLQVFAVTQDLGLIKSRPNTTPEACTNALVDYDNDGLAGCADDECWAVCKPLCPPGVSCAGSAPKCGDGTCSATEDCRICPTDCGTCTGTCGDFNCDTGENHSTCPNDC